MRTHAALRVGLFAAAAALVVRVANGGGGRPVDMLLFAVEVAVVAGVAWFLAGGRAR